MSAEKFAYRPEIDGLRAVAVSSVFLFHLQRQWLPGGFVGVDIFFVISGYLITSIILADYDAKAFSLARFYQRRIARIFPAFFVVALATISAAATVYSPQDLASAGAVLVAAALSIANLKFMLQGNYFELSPDAQPLLHYWSLSVEEQFYLLFPALFIVILRYARRSPFAILAALAVLSFAVNVLLTYRNPVWAFYLLPTRAWELLAGSSIAVLSIAKRQWLLGATRGLLPWVGALLIAVSFAVIEEGARFPGWIAVLPTAGAAAIILAVDHRCSRVLGVLALAPIAALGRMSYSLYLWHWPVFSVVDYHLFQSGDGLRMALKIAVSFALTFATYHLIERSARTFLNLQSSRMIAFVSFLGCVACAVTLGLQIRAHNYVNADAADIAKGGLQFPVDPGGRTVVLLGDSNGSMYGKVVRDICKHLRCNLTVLSVAAGDALPSLEGASSELWIASLAAVKKIEPDYVVVGNAWMEKLRSDPDRLALALKELEPHVGRVVLLNQPPVLPREASRQAIRSGSRPPFVEDQSITAERTRINQFLLSFASDKISVIDIAQHFELSRGEVRHADSQGRLLYQDASHLSGYGADYIRPSLQAVLAKAPGSSR